MFASLDKPEYIQGYKKASKVRRILETCLNSDWHNYFHEMTLKKDICCGKFLYILWRCAIVIKLIKVKYPIAKQEV